jgi:release factor glutamine methyltransferase
MGIKIQTIKDIRFYLNRELQGTYPEEEIRSISNIIIRSVLEINMLHQAYLNDISVNSVQVSKITDITRELKSGKPIQYILGEAVFYDCKIKLNSSTLIPRPETEELVDIIINENKGYTGRIIDFGTGSGCIAIALASNLTGSFVTGTDISDEALKMAGENARLNNVKVTFVKDDILNHDTSQFENAGIIVSNPPYVRNSEKQKMNKNVLEFEPHSALFVEDSDPLTYYYGLMNKAIDILDPGGKVYFEINEMLGSQTAQLLESFGFSAIKIVPDINGKERIIKGIKYAG